MVLTRSFSQRPLRLYEILYEILVRRLSLHVAMYLQIYVEVERARLTSRLVKKLESEGKLESATTMLLELQVETYGSMDLKEKVMQLLTFLYRTAA